MLPRIFSTTILVFFLYVASSTNGALSSEPVTAQQESVNELAVLDSKLEAELVHKGIQTISNMAFLGANDILVLEKDNGTVKRIINGKMQPEPLLDLDVVHSDGLIGITATMNDSDHRYVFLFVTQSPKTYGEDIETNEEMISVEKSFGYAKECNCVYRYELVENKLVNPALLLELPATPGPMHNGGEITIGPDDNLYVSVGDVTGYKSNATSTKAQNYINGPDPDGRAGILVISQDGKPVEGILGSGDLLARYYAYGIRSSFGLDFDPVTNNLWATENGPDHGDEINLVEPGFNSGADYIFGSSLFYSRHSGDNESFNPNRLVNFDGKGKYSDPEFVWDTPIGVTALVFMDSASYGKDYENDIFVADVNNGNIYHFDLGDDRSKLLTSSPLDDLIADDSNETATVLFATGSGGITDLQVGPDGYLYILSTQKNYANPPLGTIYRIVPRSQ